MSLSRLSRVLILPAAFVIILLFNTNDAVSQKKKKARPTGAADELLKPKPRDKRPDLPPSRLPLEFIKGERIALVGSSTAERMNLFGHFETLLHLRYPDKELVVRNFARPADEVGVRQRPNDYLRLGDPMAAFNPDTLLCFFGYNESFAGKDGVEKFKADYEKLLDEYAQKYPRDDAGSPPRLVLVSPIAFEPTGDPNLPDGKKHNESLKLYAEAARAVAARRKLAFVELFD